MPYLGGRSRTVDRESRAVLKVSSRAAHTNRRRIRHVTSAQTNETRPGVLAVHDLGEPLALIISLTCTARLPRRRPPRSSRPIRGVTAVTIKSSPARHVALVVTGARHRRSSGQGRAGGLHQRPDAERRLRRHPYSSGLSRPGLARRRGRGLVRVQVPHDRHRL